jgi:hypothetical protein
VIGIDDAVKDAAGVVHTAGKLILSAFGAGAVAQPLENLESQAGILPQWAGGKAPAPVDPSAAPIVNTAKGIIVSAPDVVMLQIPGSGSAADKTVVIPNVALVNVLGGKRVVKGSGTYSKPWDKKSFTTAFSSPKSVIVTSLDGTKVSYDGVRGVVFLGGTESVAGVIVGDFFADLFSDVMKHPEDVAVALATGGVSAPISYGGRKFLDSQSKQSSTYQPGGRIDPSTYAKYQAAQRAQTQAQANLAAAQQSLQAAQAASGQLPSPIKIDVPTGWGALAPLPALDTGADMSSDLSVLGAVVVGEMTSAICVEEVEGPVHISADTTPAYVIGTDVLGAPSSSAARPKRPDHKAIEQNAARAKARADASAAKLQRVLAAHVANPHTALPAAKTAIRGWEAYITGLIGAGPAPLTSKQKTLVARHSNAVAANNASAQNAQKALQKVTAASAAVVKGSLVHQGALQKLATKPKGKVGIHGDTVLGGWEAQVFGDGPTSHEQDLSMFGEANEFDILGNSLNYTNIIGAGEWEEIVGYEIEDTRGTPHTAAPGDAVYYRWDLKPYNVASGVPVGSYSYFYGPQGDGNKGQHGFKWETGNGWVAVRNGQGKPLTAEEVDARPGDKGGDDGIWRTSMRYGWGPLVGNPADSDFAGLQKASDGSWFWPLADAPPWATMEADKAAALLQKQADDAQAAADAADAAAADKMAKDQAAAQAQQDAANALAQSAADTQANIAAQQLAAQQAAADLQNQQQQAQLDAAQAAADIALNKQWSQVDMQQAAADIAAQQAEVQMMTQNPDAYIKLQQAMQAQQDYAPQPDDAGITDREGGIDQFDRGGADGGDLSELYQAAADDYGAVAQAAAFDEA